MTESYAALLHAVGVVLATLGFEGPAVLLVTLGATALVGAMGAALVALVRLVLAARPRILAVGSRDRRHAVQLGHLPDAAHPDARGHIRSRAPGLLLPAA
ncbi:hypothetical protein [Homoserinibacter sp. GY 40078]|uniref:hypothetical protein n=1 Tax=Homoserinibacter sp. GY 40078 TaxID=2603275 RepID=UPI0011C84291|nr:hypothetical protein [Homoserinibacter sp. GY 40078]TXK19629.1 hypothetical protein FVQ89_07090 [Homoserinibacter sp. GY 40078]